jgi:ATP/maltotriose-dependent transcriptional regulator MalT
MVDGVTEIDRARDALAREGWAEAYELLRSIDPAELAGRDLEGLAEAAWWRSEVDESIAARQRAYSAYVAESEEARAAYMAVRLSVEHFTRGEPSVGAGWLQRARSHAEGRPESAEHGYLAVVQGRVALEMGDPQAAIEQARRGGEIGLRSGDADLRALATMTEGLCTIASGHVEDGLGLLDESMTAVLTGELSAYFTGVVYCTVIDACLDVSDVRRAGEWSEAAREWCRSIPPDSPYPGQCRVARAEVARLRGEWVEAEAEALRATEEMLRIDPRLAGSAFAKVGEVRLRRGDLAGAEEAFTRTHELGSDPQPGLALLRLAQGKPDAARRALEAALADPSAGPTRRAALLVAAVEVALAAEDLDAARSSAEELAQVAESFETAALGATAATARGAVALAEGDVPEALGLLRRACVAWQELRLPFETARARARYGLALRQAGDEDDALLELRAALAGFERLGAASEAAALAEQLGEPSALPAGLTSREAEVLRLVATGKTNRDIAIELVISEHTVARHLQNIYGKIQVTSRSAATAYAFEHGLS